jgi:hypothetical protein
MRLDLNFYGHSVTIDPSDIADVLSCENEIDGIDEKAIDDAINNEIDNCLEQERPTYRISGKEDLVKAIKAKLAEIKAEQDEENDLPDAWGTKSKT